MEQLITIEKEETGFSIIKNKLLKDERLSWKARGIMSYLISHDKSWKFYKSEILKHSDKDGKESFNSGIKELKEFGYLEINKLKDEKGQYFGYKWTLNHTPKTVKTENRKTRISGKPYFGKTASNKTNNNKTNNNTFSKEKGSEINSEQNKSLYSSKRKPITLKENSKFKKLFDDKTNSLPQQKIHMLKNNIKQIINHWNKNITKPCRKHKFKNNIPFEKQTNIIANTYVNLVDILKSYCPDDITYIINIFNNFLKNKNDNYSFAGLEINIDEFFTLKQKTKNIINKNKSNPLKNKNSWFDIIANIDLETEEEILEELNKHFGGMPKDNNIELTKCFEEEFLKVSSRNKKLTAKEKSHLIKASSKCLDFYNKNKNILKFYHYQNEFSIVKLLFEHMNWNTNIQSYFFISQDFWDTDVPKLLKQIGYMK